MADKSKYICLVYNTDYHGDIMIELDSGLQVLYGGKNIVPFIPPEPKERYFTCNVLTDDPSMIGFYISNRKRLLKDNQYNKNRKPFYIEIEGLDGCGKTTTAKSLCERLELLGFKTLYVHFPNYDTPSGKLIKSYLSGDCIKSDLKNIDPYLIANLYVLDRYAYFSNNKHELEKYDFVIFDRGYISTYIYQGVYASKEVRDDIKKLIYEHELPIISEIFKDGVIFMLGTSSLTSNMKLLTNRKCGVQSNDKDIHEDNMTFLKDIYTYISSLEKEQNSRPAIIGDMFIWNRINIDNPNDSTIYSTNHIVKNILRKIFQYMDMTRHNA